MNNKLWLRNVIFFILISFFAFACNANGQQISAISGKCQSPYQLTKGAVRVLGTGDITYTPCATRSSIFYGNVDFTNAVITGAVTGSGTTNYVPRWTGSSALGNTPFSWDNTVYTFQNTTLDSTFALTHSPVSGSGYFLVGDATDTSIGGFSINQGGTSSWASAGNITIRTPIGNDTNLTTRNFNAGDLAGAGNSARFSLSNQSQWFYLENVVLGFGSDCTGTVVLGGAGTSDLTTTACWAWAANIGTQRVLATPNEATVGTIFNAAGLLTSTAGTADAGKEVTYWITAS